MPYQEGQLVNHRPAEIQRFVRQFGWNLQYEAARALASHSWSYIRGLALEHRSRLDRAIEQAQARAVQPVTTPENRVARRVPKMPPKEKHKRARPVEDIAADQALDLSILPKAQYHGTLTYNQRGGNMEKMPIGPKMTSWWRWQTISHTPYSGGTKELLFRGDRFAGEGYLYAGMPVYCINVSGIPYGGAYLANDGTMNTGYAYTPGLYRLYKYYNQTVNAANYFWAPVTGLNNSPTGATQAGWNFERKSDPSRGYVAPQFYEYQHHYTKAQVAFTGSPNYNYRGFVELVKFKKEQGPMRATLLTPTAGVTTARYVDGVGVTGSATYFSTPVPRLDPTIVNEVDVFWDQKLSRLTGQVLRNPTKDTHPKSVYTSLASKTVDICRPPTVDATKPCICHIDVMYKNGGIYFSGNEDQGMDQVNQRYMNNNPTSNYQYYTQALTDVSQKAGMFAEYESDTWMMIYCAATENSADGNGTGVIIPAVSRGYIDEFVGGQPSFDLVCRSKFTTLASGTTLPV